MVDRVHESLQAHSDETGVSRVTNERGGKRSLSHVFRGKPAVRNGPSSHNARSSSASSSVSRNPQPPILSFNKQPHHLYPDEINLLERLDIDHRFDVQALRLDPVAMKIYEENPHLREVFMNGGRIVKCDQFERRLLSPTSRVTQHTTGSTRYSTTEYWGQRKLLLTEIEFLTKYGDGHCMVIYAGAAPGLYINYLSSLFSDVDFVLYDTKNFIVRATEAIKIQAEEFSDRAATYHSKSKTRLLFICNIHTFTGSGNFQRDIENDMINQLRWCEQMRPDASLLNFRIPNGREKIECLEGHWLIEPWSSRRGTECRLMVKKGAKRVMHKTKDFTDAIQHFQQVTRVMYHSHDMDAVQTEGLDHCYDCQAEITILEGYLTKVKKITDVQRLKRDISAMSHEISGGISNKNQRPVFGIPRTLDMMSQAGEILPRMKHLLTTNVQRSVV